MLQMHYRPMNKLEFALRFKTGKVGYGISTCLTVVIGPLMPLSPLPGGTPMELMGW